ncbi:MAG: DUF2589 domain-containing protein [Cytophagales bacterium]|nr:DUF2589 domain-containing protein [Cytophagales bacterium]
MEEKKETETADRMSLSSALLAPINSIFEAQIHAARAFLNFILQMGFRHQPTDEDRAEQPPEADMEKPELAELNALEEKRKTDELSDQEVSRLKALKAQHGELYYQFFEYIDNSGKKVSVSIPNLALLPVKPLAVTEANFSYQFGVETQSKKYRQMGTESKKFGGKEPNRPWYLITDPRSLQGTFCEPGEGTKARAIKVDIKVGSTEIPYGLEKLMVHLTNNIEVIDDPES